MPSLKQAQRSAPNFRNSLRLHCPAASLSRPAPSPTRVSLASFCIQARQEGRRKGGKRSMLLLWGFGASGGNRT